MATPPLGSGLPRIGLGIDAHRLAEGGRSGDASGEGGVVLAGVTVSTDRSVVATSDGDVAAHAVCDALLGAAAMGDIGDMFPSSDARWSGADSMEMLARVVERLAAAGFAPTNVDLTVVAEAIRVSPHRSAMRTNLATVLGLDLDAVSVKATTTDGMGFLGRDEGIACLAVAGILSTPT